MQDYVGDRSAEGPEKTKGHEGSLQTEARGNTRIHKPEGAELQKEPDLIRAGAR